MKQRGFTLIELLISITILGIIMTITYSSFNGILRMKKTLEERRETRQQANAILRRMMMELQKASDKAPLLPAAGATTNPNPPTRVMDALPESSSDGTRRDSIIFMANNAGQYLPDGHHNAGIVQISYRLVETPAEYRISDTTRTWSLVREEIPDIRPFEEAYERAVRFPVSYSVTRLRFDFYTYDNRGWRGDWGGQNSSTPPLPDLIRLTIGILSPSGREELFTTAVALASG